jgi:hypothetical protein
MTGQPYFEDCEGLLTALANEDIEKFFLGQVQSKRQALQILADYGLIYSEEFRLALVKTLADRGVDTPTLVIDNSGRYPTELRIFLKRVLEITSLPEDDFKVLVTDILKNFKIITLANATNDKWGILRSHIQTRFVAAVEQLENRYVILTFNKFVRASLLATARDLFETQTRTEKLNASHTFIISASGIMAGTAMFVAAAAADWIIPKGFPLRSVTLMILDLSAYVEIGLASFLGLTNVGLTADQWVSRLRLSKRLAQQGSVARFDVTTDGGVVLERTNSLLRDQKQTFQYSIASLEEVCATPEVCNWSPVQLAYLGHLELIEAQERGEFIRGYFKKNAFGNFLSNRFLYLYKMAKKLRAQPESRRLRYDVPKEIFSLARDFELAAQDIQRMVAELNDKIATAQNQIDSLRAFFANRETTPAEPKHQLILAKIQSDLATWNQAAVDEKALLQVVSGIRDQLTQLRKLGAREIYNPSEARKMASEVMVILSPLVSDDEGQVQ